MVGRLPGSIVKRGGEIGFGTLGDSVSGMGHASQNHVPKAHVMDGVAKLPMSPVMTVELIGPATVMPAPAKTAKPEAEPRFTSAGPAMAV